VSLLPSSLIDSLTHLPGFDAPAFAKVHETAEPPVSIRFNPLKFYKTSTTDLPIAEKIPWTSKGYYLQQRPSFTSDPLFHAGLYYVQEASGMFLEEAMKQTCDLSKPLRVLDLCAAPGGKSTLLQSLLTDDSLLVSNEVIRQRVNVLEENCTKWGATNIVVTSSEASEFSRLNNFFDVIVVDAPCSGSGLFRKDPDAVQEWSEAAVAMCALRQQRILTDACPSLKENGILIYATCSYSEQENESICDWLIDSHDLTPLPLKIDPSWNIIESVTTYNAFGYRFFPHLLKGEGFFLACFIKTKGNEISLTVRDKDRLPLITRNEEKLVDSFFSKNPAFKFVKWNDNILALPLTLWEILPLLQMVYVKKAGVEAGRIAHGELIPAHALALSHMMNDQFVAVSLKREDALQYLRRQEVKIDTVHKGWLLIQYQGLNLGWVKALGNRINNYYPKEWRILKSGNN
jgi:16S rRNA C967 or C1407 C5-methylase (RsmB/RsmF family)/NOL1/NOP2/fmu family ribosome biogenesis protein